MAVTIRLARHGRKKIPFYRIVATDKDYKRDGRYLEQLGTMNPLTDPITVNLKEDRVKHWISLGAYPSATVARIIATKIPGYLEGIEKARLEKVRAARAKRKARAAKSPAKKKEASTEKKAKKKPAAKKAKA
ncbi:MAG: 30S ribosomal protein S16 [Bdellovibrionota bacterium]